MKKLRPSSSSNETASGAKHSPLKETSSYELALLVSMPDVRNSPVAASAMV